MRNRRLSLVAMLGVVAAALVCPPPAEALPRQYKTTGRIKRACPSSGASTAATLQPGYYLFVASGARTCLCQGTATCADTEAKSPLCLPPDAGIEIRIASPTVISCWSEGSGNAELNPWVP
ncbi:hypothetical protein [Vulgatibacter sp.]|uniref:hypothetical protein n=1 Tax=Vulgatibacter sp. TaxID=1971226 RepID=UPI00356829DD